MASSSRVDYDRKVPRREKLPNPTSPPSPQAPTYEDCVRRTPTTFNLDSVGPTPTVNGDSLSGGGVSNSSAPYTSEKGITPAGAGADAGAAADDGGGVGIGALKVTARREEVEMRYDAYVWVDALRKYWALFIVGNLISAAVVVVEISRVNGCFDDVKESQAGSTAEVERDTEASLRFLVLAVLIFGLVTELVSAIVLSFVYESPLDIKSLRKVPPQDIPTFEASVVVNVVAPLSWAVVYICGSFVSLQVDTFSSCGGHEGSVLKMYLIISGWGMLLVGLGMLGLAGFLAIYIFSCGSQSSPQGNVCTADKIMYGRWVLSKAALFDIFWQLQGSVWLYRTGGVGGRAFVVLVVFCIVGGVLAALGSRAPVSTAQGLPSTSPRLVLAQPPDAAGGA